MSDEKAESGPGKKLFWTFIIGVLIGLGLAVWSASNSFVLGIPKDSILAFVASKPITATTTAHADEDPDTSPSPIPSAPAKTSTTSGQSAVGSDSVPGEIGVPVPTASQPVSDTTTSGGCVSLGPVSNRGLQEGYISPADLVLDQNNQVGLKRGATAYQAGCATAPIRFYRFTGADGSGDMGINTGGARAPLTRYPGVLQDGNTEYYKMDQVQ